jgi:hypothetical protein
MGVMAFYTIAFHHNFVTAFGVLGYNSFMTLIADFVWIFAEQFSVGRRMRVMTFCAFSRLYGGMNKWVLELFLEGVMAFETEFPLGTRFQLEFVLLPVSCRKKQSGSSNKR